MATRRRMLPTAGYGPGSVPRNPSGRFPVPPPPDGTVPNRLPVGVDLNGAPGDPMAQMQGGGGGDDTAADPLQAILRLLNQRV